MSISDTIKQALYNGRINKGKFRRGLWSADELNKASIDGKPDIPADAVKLYYSDGCIAFYITSDKRLVINNNNRQSDTTKAIIAMFQSANKGCKIENTDALAGAVRSGGASRDWDAVFQM